MSADFDNLLERIEEQGDADEAERILGMDDAQLDAELVAGGLDAAAVRAKGRLLGEAAVRAGKRARWVRAAKIGGVVAAVVAILVAFALVWLRTRSAERPRPVIGPDDTPSVPRTPIAKELRLEASQACDEGRWVLCEQKLDEAKRLDPAGDTDPQVTRLRQQAYDGQHPPPEKDLKNLK